MWIYILILFATHVLIFLFGLTLGFMLKTQKEDPPEYDWKISESEETESKSTGPQPNKKAHKFAVIAIPLLFVFSACIPSSTPEPEIIERHCAIADLKPKPSIEEIEWLDHDGLRCLTPIEYDQLKEGTSLIRSDANYCRNVYKGVQERCKE